MVKGPGWLYFMLCEWMEHHTTSLSFEIVFVKPHNDNNTYNLMEIECQRLSQARSKTCSFHLVNLKAK